MEKKGNKLEYLSRNLNIMLDEVFFNENLCKFIFYDLPKNESPLDQDYVPTEDDLLFKRVFPYPFDPEVTEDDGTQLRIYYDYGDITDTVVESVFVNFDIIVSKSLWLTQDKHGNAGVRALEIINEIVNTFSNRSIGTIGRLEFIDFRHLYVNKKFDAICLKAKMTTLGK